MQTKSPNIPRAPRSSSVARALEIIESLAGEPSGLGVVEIARRLSMDVGQMHRLLKQLTDAGWVVQRTSAAEYEVSDRLLTVASRKLEHTLLRDIAIPVIDALADESGETVHLAEWREGHLVCIARKVHQAPVVATAHIGEIWELNDGSAAAVSVRAAAREGLRRVGDAGMIMEADDAVETAIAFGFAHDRASYRAGVEAVASSIVSLESEIVGSLVLSAPVQRATPDRMAQLGKMVSAAAQQIGRSLGAPQPVDLIAPHLSMRTSDLFRHLTDLRERKYEGSVERVAQEETFRHAVSFMTPHVFAAFSWINDHWLRGQGTWEHVREVATDDGLRSEWRLTWPALEASHHRFTGEALGPIRVVAYLREQHIHGHLRGEFLGDWPLQVTSDDDARRQIPNVLSAIEGDLHEKIFLTAGDWRLVPSYAASVMDRDA